MTADILTKFYWCIKIVLKFRTHFKFRCVRICLCIWTYLTKYVFENQKFVNQKDAL